MIVVYDKLGGGRVGKGGWGRIEVFVGILFMFLNVEKMWLYLERYIVFFGIE